MLSKLGMVAIHFSVWPWGTLFFYWLATFFFRRSGNFLSKTNPLTLVYKITESLFVTKLTKERWILIVVPMFSLESPLNIVAK